MRVQVSGKGEIACNALSFAANYARQSDLELFATPNSDDRGYDTWYPSLAKRANQLGVPIVDLYEFTTEPNLILISLEFDKIVKVQRFASRQLYNIHFSLLPKYRGVYTSIWPILNNERSSGVTLHVMDAGADTGPIVAQREFPLRDHVTARGLYGTYMAEAFLLFREYFIPLLRNSVTLTPQDDAGATYYDRQSLNFAHARQLAFNRSADFVERQARAFTFPEYQLPVAMGRPVRACYEVVGVRHDSVPGDVLAETTLSCWVACAAHTVVELVWA